MVALRRVFMLVLGACILIIGVAVPLSAYASPATVVPFTASTKVTAAPAESMVVEDVNTTITPTGGTIITGRVKCTTTGTGVSDVEVYGFNDPSNPLPVIGGKYGLYDVTDSNGYFRIVAGVIIGGAYDGYTISVIPGLHKLTAYKANYTTVTTSVRVVENVENKVNFSLRYEEPAGTIAFDLKDAVTGAKTPWNYVLVANSSGAMIREYKGPSAVPSFTMSPGFPVYVWIWSLGYGSGWYPNAPGGANSLSVQDDETLTISVRFSKVPSGTLSAPVTDDATGQGIEGIEVIPTLYSPAGSVVHSPAPFITAANGVASGSLLPGAYRVEYRDPAGKYGLETYNNRLSADWADFVTVSPGQTTTTAAGLSAGYSIAGTLQHSDGTPIRFGHGLDPEGVEVFANDSVRGFGLVTYARANTDGTFAVSGLAAGTYYVRGKIYSEMDHRYLYHWVDTASELPADATPIVIDGSTPTITVDVKFPIEAYSGVPADRYGGPDRYSTAAEIALRSFDSADTAILATGERFPDALAASSLAGAMKAPMLLSRGTSIDWSTLNAMKSLGVSRVVIVGSTASVSAAVEYAISCALPAVKVERIGGKDRYQTARLVAQRVVAEAGASEGAFLVRGDSFADALAVSPLAYTGVRPVVLTPPTYLGAEARLALTTLGIDDVTIVGSTAAVGSDVQTAVAALPGMTVRRVFGANRYSTTTAVACWGIDNGLVTSEFIGLATGLNFPDALGGGVAAGQRGGVLLLTAPASLSPETATFLSQRGTLASALRVYGSTAGVSDNAYSQAMYTLPYLPPE